MEKFKVAHIHEQGQDIIIVLVNRSFANKSSTEQGDICSWLQGCARSAGLAGIVVPVWESGGRLFFLAPPAWLPFFKSLTIQFVQRNINKELSCSD